MRNQTAFILIMSTYIAAIITAVVIGWRWLSKLMNQTQG